MVELFDTTPDLAGADIDVSRFIRETDEHDVQVFWRDFTGTPDPEQPGPSREELCSVPIGDIKGAKRGVWRWNHIEKQWVKQNAIFPGLVLMLRADEGGYGAKLGWTGKEKRTSVMNASCGESEAYDDDALMQQCAWQTIAEHTDAVVNVLDRLIVELPADLHRWKDVLLYAARWHDAGKAHGIFQGAIPDDAPRQDLWAKSRSKMKRYKRPGFRHELASAIAMLQNGQPDLAAYLAAAHHGKVRLSIRSLPHEKQPVDEKLRFARGIWDGDMLPATDLGGNSKLPETSLDLSFMELGKGSRGPSWLARMLALRDDPKLGLFRLAYLEALLRIADWRASGDSVAKASEEVKNEHS
jgi:CRISPR-associated endonuclease/helicase Cas3